MTKNQKQLAQLVHEKARELGDAIDALRKGGGQTDLFAWQNDGTATKLFALTGEAEITTSIVEVYEPEEEKL